MLVKLIAECFSYDPSTGALTWRPNRPREHFSSERGFRTWKSRFSLRPLHNSRADIRFTVRGIEFKVPYSAACWSLAYGELPDKWIDHKNGNHFDNSLQNLRKATPTENARNMKIHKDNACGLKGVFYAKHARKFAAQICINGKRKHLGYFKVATDAHHAYQVEASKAFGEFARPA
jgi:hypothetical protein